MSTIDYSKWDKIGCSSSEEEEEEQSPLAKPRVTRLDQPSRVTRTSDGDLVVEELPPPPTQPNTSKSTIAFTKGQSPKVTSSTDNNAPHHNSWIQNGSQETTASQQTLYWSQDRASITLRLSLPSTSIRGKDIKVQLKGVRPYTDRSMAVGNTEAASIRITCNYTGESADNNTPSSVLLEGDFPHLIHAAEDDDDYVDQDTPYFSSDWSIDRTENNAYFVMTLSKAVPMEGITIWWRQPLTQFSEIDANKANPNAATQKSQAFQQAWEEAHRQFREKAKQPHTLP